MSEIGTPRVLSDKKRALLELLLDERRQADAARRSAVPKRPDGVSVPLTAVQRQLWFLHLLYPGLSAYHVPVAFRLRGALDIDALHHAVRTIVQRHEALRSRVVDTAGTLTQVADPVPAQVLHTADIAAADLHQEISTEVRLPFDLTRGPMLRARLMRLDNDDHVLQLTLHHIACDGWSLQILLRELAAAYDGITGGQAAAVADLPLDYGDYACWLHERTESPEVRQQVEYFRGILAGAPASTALLTDRPRPGTQRFHGARRTATVPTGVTTQLRALCGRESVTPFMVTLAAYGVLLRRYSGQSDVVIGSPTSGRHRPELEGLVGFFASALPWRIDLNGEPSFTELVHRVKDAALGVQDHQEAPLDRIVNAVRPARDLARTPLFQVAFALYDEPDAPALRGLDVLPIDVDPGSAKFDLVLEVFERRHAMRCALEFDTDLFDEATADRMLRHFLQLLEAATSAPDAPVTRLPMLTSSERAQMLGAWNDTSAIGDQTPVHVRFEGWAKRRPDADAVSQGAERLSYGALNERANQLANQLVALGASPGMPVALCLERSIDLVVAMLASLKAGAPYVPLDPAWPSERLSFVLRDVTAPVVVTTAPVARRLGAISGRVLCVDTDAALLASLPTANLTTASGADLAYIIYTSGSTGHPKGVLIPQEGLSNLVDWHVSTFSIRPEDRASQLAAVAFDACTWEIWPYLSAGAGVCLAHSASVTTPGAIWRWLADEGITRCFMPTPLAELLLREPLPPSLRLRTLLVGGDRLGGPAPPGTPFDLVNNYGPTETSVVATSGLVTARAGDPAPPHIGRPIANTQVYVLDAAGEPVPVGVAGELHIAGRGLARGYLNRAELTAAKFVANPFDPAPNARMYRTGDLVRYRDDGNLDFLGRIDHQVKIRGFRIEPGEIEIALRSFEAVDECIVVPREDSPGDKHLVAYVGTAATPLPAAADLRAYLLERLPEYMVPAAFVILRALPLTPNGKVDRAALPAVAAPSRAERHTSPAGIDLQEIITQVWRDELRVVSIGPDDSFFDLGGHSLAILRVQHRLQEVLGVDLSVVDLFQHPTVSALARFLARLQEDERPATTPRSPSDEIPRDVADPIAVIGMAGRFPGAHDVEALWDMIRQGREALVPLSDEALAAAGVERSEFEAPGYVKSGGVLEGVDRFDAAFFGFSPREAEITDPQHRMFLECAHEALERAGYNPHLFAGAIGVFAGSAMSTYLMANVNHNRAVRSTLQPAQAMVANDKDFLPTRVSYKLNLRGPSVNVQSACSTSLVAVHMACRSLADGACDMALAGGVSIRVPHPAGYPYMEGGILSPDGHCRPFDAKAAGTVAGSGAGIVVLKRLSRAIADGDSVLAVITGSAINNDGAVKVGFTAPSVDGQAAVIRAAQQAAGVDPRSISYVEAHGTGTHLGDPIEVAALTKAFREGTPDVGFCALGAVKSNVGHLDTAAGVTGLIKTVLQLQHRQLAPTLHFETPNPRIDFASSPFVVNDRLRAWDSPEGPRRAGVSSFGMGGTNAHVVLEEAPAEAPPSNDARDWQILTLSAKTLAALDAATDRLGTYLEQTPGISLADVAYTLHVGRTPLAHRRVVTCDSPAAAVAAFRASDGDAVRTGVNEGSARQIVFLFPGQGAQYAGMAAGLYRQETVFREEIDRCAGALRPLLGRDLRELLFDATPEAADLLRETWLTQPAIFMIEYALARLWLAWGVRPAAMIGHSIGEYVAACLAGVMAIDDALRLVARRGQLMHGMPAGAMLAVPLGEDEARAVAAGRVDIAAVNGLLATVLSGKHEAIAQIEHDLAARGDSGRRLHTSHAFHSEMMDPVLAEFAAAVARVPLQAPAMPFVSNVTGTWITAAEATDPEYWARHLRSTVRFAAGLDPLFALDRPVFLESGPGGTLGAYVRKRAAGRGPKPDVIASLPSHERPQDDRRQIMVAVGELWRAGGAIDWHGFHRGETRRRVPLPTYPFQRQRYFIEPDKITPTPAFEGRRADRADWFSVPSWERAHATHASRALDGRTVVLGHGVFAERIRTAAHAAGSSVIRVVSGPAFRQSGEDGFEVDPGSVDDLGRMLSTLRASGGVRRIVHAWLTGSEPQSFEDAYLGLLALVQAASRALGQSPFDLALITSGGFDVTGDEPLTPAHAAIASALRVVPREYPHIRCTAIDLDHNQIAEATSDAAAHTIRVLAGVPPETVALRGAHQWMPMFRPVRLDAAITPGFVKGGVYVVTGGMGGMALEIAHDLARSAHATVVLVGRSAVPDRAVWDARISDAATPEPTRRRLRRLRDIEDAGGRVIAVAADVSDASAMREALTGVEAQAGRIRGVVHAAGVGGGALIERQSRGLSAPVLAPKIGGTDVLVEFFADRDLDFFVLCSSQRSIVPAPGRFDYCAANAYLDAVSVARAGRGRWPLTSIVWDNWRDSGMGAIDEAAAASDPTLEHARALSLSNDEGVDVFRRALHSGLPVVVVSTRAFEAVLRDGAALTVGAIGGSHVEALAEAPQHERPELATAYAAPATPAQRTLAGIWQQLLGVDRIGIHDNFFELGGDSVVSIQMIARAARTGLRLSAKDVFQRQTVAELAEAVESAGASGPTSDPLAAARVAGAAALSPIQHWFFAQDPVNVDHFNQAVMLRERTRVPAAALDLALTAVVAQHDALHARYEESDGVWRCVYQAPTGQSLLQLVDLRTLDDDALAQAIETHADGVQTSFDVRRGHLIRAVRFDCGPARPARLLLAAHHLAIDLVSWRLLLETLQTACQQVIADRPIDLPAPSAGFKAWADRLAQHASGGGFAGEREYWMSLGRGVAPLPTDLPVSGPPTMASAAVVRTTIPEQTTQAVLRDLPRAHHTQVTAAFLAALSRTFHEWIGAPVLVEMEGLGRDPLFDDVDTSRTVGWFTTINPVRAEWQPGQNVRSALHAARTQLGTMPTGGLGYGALRQLGGTSGIAPLPAGVCFLYLGQTGLVASDAALFEPAAEPVGRTSSASRPLSHQLTITVAVVDGAFQCDWAYSGEQYRQNTIERVAALFTRAIVDLVQDDASPVTTAAAAVPAAAESQTFPLTPMQQGMLFHTLSSPDAAEYFRHVTLTLEGDLQVPEWQAAWQSAVRRHSALRTAVQWEGLDEPVQIVSPDAVPVEWTIESWLNVSDADADDRLTRFVEADSRRPFDLGRPPLMRCALFARRPGVHAFVWSFHHLVLDGWSFALVLQEVLATYAATIAGQTGAQPPAPQFTDYLEWLAKRPADDGERFWRAHLRGFDAPTPVGAAASADGHASTATYAEVRATFAPAIASRVQAAARAGHVTVNAVVQAAWGLLLSRYAGTSDVVFGAVVSGRPVGMPGVERTVGMFINTLPVRLRVNPAEPLGAMCQRLQLAQAEAREYEYAPLWKVQSWSEVPRPQPLFESLVVYENYPLPADLSTIGGLRLRLGASYERTNYPLTLTVPGASCDGILFTYNTSRFTEDGIQRLAGHVETILEAFGRDAGQLTGEVSLLTERERHQIVAEWNATGRDLGGPARLHRLVEAQAARTPEAVALRFEDRTLTYAEMSARANQLARVLRAKGVGPDVLVGVLAERSFEMVVAVLAVLKAGGAYVPLDPDYPAERLSHMLEDARAPLVLAQTHLAGALPTQDAEVLTLDDSWASYAHESPQDLLDQGAPDDLAYVIFTSGSTGRPKGAMNTHRGICNRLLWMQETYGLNAADRVLQKTPFSFDVSVWEFFWPLMTGAPLVIARREGHKDPRYLVDLIRATGITTLHFVPSMLRVFLDEPGLESCPSIRRVICSGEALPYELQERLFARLSAVELHNLYGPTEAAVDVTYWACRRGDARLTVPIGRPVANTRMYVLDPWMQPVPAGVAGELYIGGVQVGRGYVGRPALTAERFVPDPFVPSPGARLYKTGDLARYLPDGEIEYLGRLDNQVKIRGQRIELGEIEAVLDSHAAVAQSVVLAREDVRGDQRLVAYIVTREAGAAAAELKGHLAQQVPAYMVPSAFVFLDALPLTSSGKVDRRALPAPDHASSPDRTHVAARDDYELPLVAVFERVLGVSGIGVEDSFFELGGHSLVAVRLMSQIEKTFGRNLPLATLFDAPTVAQLAQVLRRQGWAPPWNSLVALQPRGTATPFFCVHSLGSNLVSYRKLAQLVGADQPFFGLQPHGLDGSAAPHETLEEMAAHYLREVQGVQPRGPYRLGGVCLGGVIALEMAQQLRAMGEDVALLAMIDSYFPGDPKHLPAYVRRWSVTSYADYYLGDVLLRSTKGRAKYILTRLVNILGRGLRVAKRATGLVYPRVLDEGTLARALGQIQVANRVAERRYVPRCYDGRINLFWCSEQPVRAYQDSRLAWDDIASDGLETHVVPGNHMSMVEEPHVHVLAAKLRAALDRTESARRGGPASA